MISKLLQFTLGLLVCSCALLAQEPVESGGSGRERINLDSNWRFALGDATHPARDFNHGTGYFSYLAKTGYGDGAAAPAFDDRAWRTLDLPHDWAVEVPFDPKASASHGYKAVGPRFPQNSVGWYRHHFTVSADELGRRLSLEFDGVYRNARVFVNGFFVGEEPSGYNSYSYDITDYLNYGGDNVIAVRVDASMEEGWFYEGAGIYRHVWLLKTSPVHVARYGTFVSTARASAEAAELGIETTLANDGVNAATVQVRQRVLDPKGNVVAESEAPTATIPGGSQITIGKSITVKRPALWDLESPSLYLLRTEVLQDGKQIDRYDTPFGIRTIRFDPNAGFFLNGKHVVLKGTNNHQDHAGVGAALPDALQDYRLLRLKEMGSNTYRASHNPPTPELLDACDRLGMLVIDENRLMGSNPYHLGQLENVMRRDRNHPSVILWSLGNEEWAIEGNIKGARIARTMQDAAHRIDPTRLATVAISGGWGGISTVVDVAGVNYIKQGDTDKQHAEYPWQVILGTEETTTQGTRGIYVDDRARAHLSPQVDGSSGGNAESGWKHYASRPYTAGVIFWTGFDYRGEPTPFGYPAVLSQFGILDNCGFPKDGFYYLQAWWTKETVLHLSPHWNWTGREGQPIAVRADSNCDEVELWLNGRSLGRKKMEQYGHLEWSVPYAAGTLQAKGYRGGVEVASEKVETTGAAAAVKLGADRTQLTADGRDVVVLTASIVDAAGRVVPDAGNRIQVSVTGPAKVIGMGNGDPSNLEPEARFPLVTVKPFGTWHAPEASIRTGQVVFETDFDAPAASNAGSSDAASASGRISLLLNPLGRSQTVTLNGKELYRDQAPAASKIEVPLEKLELKPTGNHLRIVADVFEDWGAREAIAQLSPAAFRFETQPEPWSRSCFNGYAQIILQSTGTNPGTVKLQVASDQLKPAEIEIRTAVLK